LYAGAPADTPLPLGPVGAPNADQPSSVLTPASGGTVDGVARMLADADRLTAAEVVHTHFSPLPASATVADVRDWFAQSAHRRMAFVADGERYVGSLTRQDLAGHPDEQRAADVARPGPTVAPSASAREGYDLAVATDSRRVPVVASDGTLVGVLAVTEDLSAFCGSSH